MQPLAIYALITGAVMILGVAVTLILTRHAAEPRRAAVDRWNMHGSFPLAAAGVVIGVISRRGGQSPATRNVVYVVAATLLLAALLCALVGAARAGAGWFRSGRLAPSQPRVAAATRLADH